MAIQFDFYETPIPAEREDGKKHYHARPVTFSTIGTEDLIDNIQERCSLTKGDIRAALSALSDSLIDHLGDGHRVYFEGIGYFQVALSCPKDCDPNKTRAQSVSIKSVKYRADQELKNRLSHIKLERSSLKRHSTRLSQKQIDEKLKEYFKTEETLTRKDFEILCKVTRITANRHISRLVEEGKLKNIGRRLQPVYILV